MTQSRPHVQLNASHTSPNTLPGLPSNTADSLIPSRDYPSDTTRDASDLPVDPFACSHSHLYNSKGIGEVLDRQMAISQSLGPSSFSNPGYRQSLENSDRSVLSSVSRTQRNQLVLGTGSISVTMQPPQASDEPPSEVSVSAVSSGGSELWSPVAAECVPNPPRPKKRREKPRIELAPDQPPTTQGKPRARVYVACIQW